MSRKQTLAERISEAVRPVKHLKEAVDHSSKVLETLVETISAQSDDYAALQQMIVRMSQRLTIIEAGAGHMLENADWMKAILDAQSDHMMLIHNFGWLLENSDDFWRDALKAVQPEVFTAEFNQLEPTRQRELLPELFMDGGNNGST